MSSISSNTNPIDKFPLNPPSDPMAKGLITMVFNCLGIETNCEESQKAAVKGGALITTAFYLPTLSGPFKIPSWVSPCLAALGLAVAAIPTVKKYFGSFATSNLVVKETIPEEPKVPSIPLSSLGKVPTKITYSTDGTNTDQASPTNSDALNQLKKARIEIQKSNLNIGGTPLYSQLVQGTPETEPSVSTTEEDLLTKSIIAKAAVEEALNQISAYITNMEPILKAKIHLSSVIQKTNEELLGISNSRTINKTEVKNLIGKINNAINSLENSINALATEVQTVVPGLDYVSLNLRETEKIIRNNSLDDRVDALNSLKELKQTYKAALDAVQSLCDLKDAAEDLEQAPSPEKLESMANILIRVNAAIELLTNSPSPPITAAWIKEATEDYTNLLIEHVSSAIQTTHKELNAIFNLSRNTDLPQARLAFLARLKDKIKLNNLTTESVKGNLVKLESLLTSLKTNIATKRTWQPTKNAVLLGLNSLTITAAITGGKLACDVMSALWRRIR